MAPIRINLMGALSVLDAGGQDITPVGTNSKAILALLALSSNGRRSRLWLQDKLWSAKDPQKGRASLRQELSTLRKHFERLELQPILTAGEDILLDLSQIELDLSGDDIPSHLELLEGFHHADPEFENWLSEERAHVYGTLAARTPSRALNSAKNQETSKKTRFFPRVAVKGINSIGSHGGLATFSAGLEQELNTVLGSVSGTYQIIAPEKPELAPTDYSLNGTVRFDGYFRVNIFVVDIKTGQQIWSARFNARRADLFSEQEIIARKIVDGLLSVLSDGAWSEFWQDWETTTEVWELYQRGRVQEHMAQKRALNRAITFYREAADLDLSFIPARISLAFCLLDSLRLCVSQDEEATIKEVRALVNEIGNGTSNNVHMLALNAFVEVLDGKFDSAVRTMSEACEKAPQSPEMLSYFGAVCGYSGDYAREQEIYLHALTFTPHPPVWIRSNLALSILLSGKTCEDELLDSILEEDESHQRVLIAQTINFLRKGRTADAFKNASRLVELEPSFSADKWRSPMFFANKSDQNRIATELRQAGVP